MALIAIASDKGAPGVTTAALALAAVWPRPVLLAECDPAGGDLVYRFPAVGGGRLDPRRGVLSLAVVARRGMQPQQVWEHAQKLHGGLDVLAGVTNAEQGAGLSLLWGPIGKVLASLPQADVIADCGRLGADGPLYDLLAEATTVVLVTRVHVADVIRLRDRSFAFAAAAQSRGRRGFGVGVVVVADQKKFRAALGEVQHVLGQANAPATVLGGIAHDSKGADLLSGEWGGNLDRTMLIKTAREVAQHLVYGLPPIGSAPAPPTPAPSFAGPAQEQERPAESHQAGVSAEAPRTTFSRVRGGARSGRHQADPDATGRPPAPSVVPGPTPVEVPYVSAPVAAVPATDPGRVAAKHAYNPPAYSRPPMPPLRAQPTLTQETPGQQSPTPGQQSPTPGQQSPTPGQQSPSPAPNDRQDQEDAAWDFSRWQPAPGKTGTTRPGPG